MTLWRGVLNMTTVVQDIVVWRRARLQKDRWPLLRVNWVQIEISGAPLTNVATSTTMELHAHDRLQDEHAVVAMGWQTPGVLYDFAADRTAIGSELIVQELSMLPRVMACDYLHFEALSSPTGNVLKVVIDYDLFFIEDHEAWIRKKQRDCHDEN